MLRWLRSIDWLAINSSALALLISIQLLSSYLVPAYQGSKQQPGQYLTEKPKNTKSILGDWEFWAAFFTGLIALYAIREYAETRRGAERQLRAYVGIDDIEFELPNLPNAAYNIPQPVPPGFIFRDHVRIRIRNSGETPAFTVVVLVNWLSTVFGGIWPVGHVLPIFYSAQDIEEASRYVVDPDRTITSTININDLTPFRAAAARRESLYIYGHIEYADIFEKRWRRDFRYIYEPWRPRGERFTPAREGNFESRLQAPE